jgi:FAD/FMN-containing dehydrogenase
MAYTKDDVIPDEGVDKLFEYVDKADKGGALWFIVWSLAGGAVNDVKPDATAYGHRDALLFHESYVINLLGKVKDESRTFLTEINSIIKAAVPGDQDGVYAGYVDPALGGEESASKYWGGNVGRLQRIKAEVDPNDVFHNPQSIRPAKGSAKMRQ